MTIQEKYNQWLHHPNLDPSLKEELKKMNDKEIEDAFYTDVQFQTAGMRGLMGAGTNRLNIVTVRKATQGLANLLNSEKKHAKVAIAYDNRYHSQEFAYDCAKMLASAQIHCYVFDSLRPTPELSYAVRYLKCDAGIMITASHNPKEYNGYKVYDANGCQLIPPLAAKVIAEIDKLEDILSLKPNADLNNEYVHIVNKEVDEAYYEQVLGISLRKDLPKDFTIAFSPECGASALPVYETLTRAGYTVKKVLSQFEPDPSFSGTKSPNPEVLDAYEGVLQTAKENAADLILVCDPDGDRMGVGVLHKGEYVLLNGNQTGAVLLEYILSAKEALGMPIDGAVMYNTIVTSDIGEAVASAHGVKTVKTLTGFKYIGDRVAEEEKHGENHYVFGYEESYGSLIAPFVRDKDATQACLMLAEACAYYRTLGKTLMDVLYDIFKRDGAYADAQMSIALPGADGAKKLKEIMQNLRISRIHEIAGKKVVREEDYLERKSFENGEASDLIGHDLSDVLKYFLEDGSFVCVRPSGTEPKCKIYLSAKAATYEEALAKNEQFKQFMAATVR